MKTMNKFIVNGNEVNAYYSSNDINDVLIPLLKRWIHIYETKKKRVIVYLAACPGSGKSTLALFLEELFKSLNASCTFQTIGMDGFHFYNDYLKKHDLLNEKGSRNTFDVEKLKSYILNTKEEDCFWPIYSRMVHDPIENQVYIQSDIVLIEGNYLLSKDAPWNELLPLCDDSVFLNVDTNILKERLIKRKSLSIGLNKAIHFYEQSDSKNIQYVLNSKQCPNIEIELSTR